MAYYLTTPIYYVNARPHLGHAYTTIVADSLVRFHTLLGVSTCLVTGTDEHGDKICQAAAKAGQAPREFADAVSAEFRALWPRLNIRYDRFIRTTEAGHRRIVQSFLQRVYDAGDIYFGEFGGHYCYGCERFYTEKELENGLCPQHLNKPEFISEKNYFFRMSKYLGWLTEHIRAHPDFIRPERYRNETLAMLESGSLEDLCISRPKTRLSWGIELPFDADFVCYVWFDALLSYLSALDGPDGGEYRTFWPGQHLIAKDILKPHAVFWPTMLKAAGLPLYEHLNVHGYWLARDAKMSKSLGNVLDPAQLCERYGLDSVRYFLLREMHFGSDASFSDEGFITRANADLANDLGNLYSRVLSMNAKYFHSLCPAPGAEEADDRALQALVSHALHNYLQLFPKTHFSLALESLWELVRALNKYVDSQAPWALYKEGKNERLGTVLYTLLEAMRKTALCLWPVMPASAAAMLEQLGQEIPADGPPTRTLAAEADSWCTLVPGTAVASSSNLFPRMEHATPKTGGKQTPKASATGFSSPDKPADAANLSFEDFTRVEMRIGTVAHAEKHPDADKLLRLEIDLGEERPRQIISGLAEHYAPQTLIGRQLCVVANLRPRDIRGLVSHGMVLTVHSEKGLALLGPSGPVPNGSLVR
ncbi:MAG: methionine--tRNA ligase [Deltaproteobacteria bacterium]|jgi:methionyl-tRNA synthetase|nr:methionine--tRNA ligase [Deltaproteobacteria bacterium]